MVHPLMVTNVVDRCISSSPQVAPPAIAYVCPGWPLSHCANGIVSYTAAMRQAMSDLGVRVSVLAHELEPAESEEGVYDLRDWQRRKTLLGRGGAWLAWRLDHDGALRRHVSRQILSAVRQLRQNGKVDVLQMEEAYGRAGCIIPHSPVPVVVRLHGPWFLTGRAAGVRRDRRYRKRLKVEELSIRQATGVTAPSRSVLELTRRHYGLELAHARVIPNIAMAAPPERRWRGDQADPEHILFVGRFDRLKGGDTMIDAFATLACQRPHCRLTFVGPDHGFVDDVGRLWSLAEYVERRLPDGNARGRFEWLGFQPKQVIQDLRSKVNVVVIASRWENFANTATEAAAMGCPIVATNSGGTSEIVQHGRNGLLFRPGDPGDLAAKIDRILDRPDLAATLGEQAVRDCAVRYAPDVIARATLDYYSQVTERRRGGRRGSID